MGSQRQLLIDLGFEAAGAWVLAGNDLVCRLARHPDRSGILYAFVVGDNVMYVGKTAKTLRWRMNQYRRPGPSQRTNQRINPQICELLAEGQDVEVLVLVDAEPIMYRGLRLSLAAGLEDALIARLDPPWNQVGRRRGA